MISDSPLKTLFSRKQPGIGLGAFSQFLTRLGDPHRAAKIIHVAGTNGKGTVSTLLARALTCAGKRTGLFVSPHIQSLTERISVDGAEISQVDLTRVLSWVLEKEDKALNFFELLTAAAFVYFAEQHVEYIVLETGLGGRKDPTNVCKPLLSIITSIGLDHTDLLGPSLLHIACEKAGIIKPGVPVLAGPVAGPAAGIINDIARACGDELTWVDEGHPFTVEEIDWQGGFTRLKTAQDDKWNLRGVGGKQALHACLVYHAARLLSVPERAVRQAFETVRLPGRFEIIRTANTTFILDGAHNPQAIENLLHFWQTTPFAGDGVLLCGFMKDKDFTAMISLLSTQFKQVILTVPPSPRAATQVDLAQLVHLPNVTFEPDVHKALARAQQYPTVLCTGSFYLVGSVRARLLR